MIDQIATHANSKRDTDNEISFDYDEGRSNSCRTDPYNGMFPKGDRFDKECDKTSNVAIKCVGISDQAKVDSSLTSSGQWSEWSEWSKCMDDMGNEIKVARISI